MAKKLFSPGGSEPISPLIDVIMNAFGAMFIILIIYLAAARPAEENAPLLFLKDFSLPPAIRGQSYLFTLPVTGGTGKLHFSVTEGSLGDWGLQFDENTGTLSGIPSWPEKKPGNGDGRMPLTAPFVFAVSDSAGNSDSVKSSLVVHHGAVPYPTTPFRMVREEGTLPTGRVGESYETVIGSTGGPVPVAWRVIRGDLPKDLKLDPATGRLHGVPNRPGTFSFELKAECTPGGYELNGRRYTWNGGEQKQSFQLTILETPKYSLHLPAGRVGEPYFAAVVCSSRLPGEQIFWDVALKDLRPSAEEGTLAGIPTQAGTFPVAYQVRKGDLVLGKGAGELRVLPAKPGIALSPVTVQAWAGEAIRYPLAYRGLVEPVRAVTTAALPEGLSLDHNEIVGTPRTPSLVTLPVRLEDALGQQADSSITLRIAPRREPLQLDGDKEVVFVAGRPAAWAPSAYGGEGSFLWQLKGELPANLTLKDNRLQGILAAPGSWTSTMEVRDQITGETKTRSLLVRGVYPEETAPALLTKALPAGTVGLPYDFLFSSTGGVGNLRYACTGTLPKGLSFTGHGISGKPVAAAESDIEVTVADETGQKNSPTGFRLRVVEDKPKLVTAGLPAAIVGMPYDVKLSAQGGIGTVKFELAGALPKGLEFTGDGIAGKPLAPEKKEFTITAVDEIGQKTKPMALQIVTVDRNLPEALSLTLPAPFPGRQYKSVFSTEGGMDRLSASWPLLTPVEDEPGQKSAFRKVLLQAARQE